MSWLLAMEPPLVNVLVYGHDIAFISGWCRVSARYCQGLRDYSIIAETGIIKIVADGYGISKNTVPSTEAVHFINVRGT